MFDTLKNWHSSTTAATAIEYVLIMAGVALAISAVTFIFGDSLIALFSSLGETVDGAVK